MVNSMENFEEGTQYNEQQLIEFYKQKIDSTSSVFRFVKSKMEILIIYIPFSTSLVGGITCKIDIQIDFKSGFVCLTEAEGKFFSGPAFANPNKQNGIVLVANIKIDENSTCEPINIKIINLKITKFVSKEVRKLASFM